MISHIGSHAESISITLRTNAAQGIQTEDIDAILGGNVGNIPDTTDDPIFDMRTVIQLGLTAPGEEPRQSTDGASVATQDTDISETPSNAQLTKMYNIDEAYRKEKAHILTSLSKALASEEKEAAALRKLAKVKEEMKQNEKESKA